MMDVEKLKQKILDLAIRGKLVPQDPNDEPASVLLEKIRQEKNKLIQEGKIKPSKDESFIYKGSDNCYYEKTENSQNDITDEIPFEIPSTWQWVRLKEIGEIVGGGTPSTSEKKYWEQGNITWITPGYMGTLNSNYIFTSDRKITDLGLTNSSAKVLPCGSIIMSSRAPIGHLAINMIPACTSQGCKSVSLYLPKINEFIFYELKASIGRIKIASKGTTFDEISATKFGNILLPVAPLSEQKRITETIKEAFLRIEEIKNSYSSIEKCIRTIKTKILDEVFGENSSYKSYYESFSLAELVTLNKGKIESRGILPYLEAKVIRGIKSPKLIDTGIFVKKGTKVILVDGENSGEVMAVPYDGYLGSTFKLLENSNRVDPDYLALFIHYNKSLLRGCKTGSAIPHLNKKIFYELQILLPPIEQQKKITKRIQTSFKILNNFAS